MDANYQQMFNALQDGWGNYAQRFQQLNPEAQTAFLSRQGYARLADLLAHVIAWWDEGRRAVQRLRDDPHYTSPDYHVDDFNAGAVASCRGLSETSVLQSFETARQAWLELLASLSADEWCNPRLVQRLHMELIGHLAEHELPARLP